MPINTNRLAINSIQKNMLGTGLKKQKVIVLLSSGKELHISCVDEKQAIEINNSLHCAHGDLINENSKYFKSLFTMELMG